MKISQKIYIRVAMSIAIVALVVSLVTSFLSYMSGLEEKRATNYSLVKQLAQTVEKTAAIAGYLLDSELADEITNGLVNNDLVKGVSLNAEPNMLVVKGDMSKSVEYIPIKLMHPFIEDSQIGVLTLYPDDVYIQQQAQDASKKEVILMMIHSIIITFFVSLAVHQRLTRPLQCFTDEFSKIDPSSPETMQMLSVKAGDKDEISRLIMRINSLMNKLKITFTNERQLREKTEELEARFRLIFEQASAGVCLVNEQNEVTLYNPAFKNCFTEKQDDVIPSLSFPGLLNESEKVYEILKMIRSDEGLDQVSVDIEYTLGTQKRWVHCLFAKLSEQRDSPRQHQESLIEIVLHDVTERAEKEFQTRFEADHDALTYLLNRGAGERELNDMLSTCMQNQEQFVLMMIDLDKFKPVNDNYGHQVGDQVLVEVARRIKNQFNQPTDICIRWGGDEFITAHKVTDTNPEHLLALARQILEDVEKPISVDQSKICNISASIGLVLCPKDGETLHQLMVNADNTMYQVKERGRGQAALYQA